jgi:glycosyltransferase involved in cell wall biosynthesis
MGSPVFAHASPSLSVVLDARVVVGSGGGPDKTILNAPRYLVPAGYRNLCAYMHHPADPGFEHLRSKAVAKAAPLLSVADRGPWDWRVFGQFLDICRRERVQIWHGHDYKSNALGLLVRRFWPMHLVTTVHGWVQQTRRTPLYYWVDRLSLRYYDKVVCVSEDLYHRCRAIGVPEDRCELIENGIDLEEYSRRQNPAEARRRLGLRNDRLLLGAAGRLSPEKGFDLLIRACDQLLREGLDFELIIVGEGDEWQALQALISQLGREDRIHLAGYRSAMQAWYETLDVFVLSSVREGLPNVLLEAMALEVPVVATCIAGIPRLVHHEHNGLLVEPGDPGQLAAALRRLLREPELRRQLGKACRETVAARYSFAARMDKFRRLYDQLLQRSGSATSITTLAR